MAYLETTNSSVQAVLVSFLNLLAPANWEIVEGRDNLVSEPEGNFMVITRMFDERLSTNYVVSADVVFTSSINGNTLTVTAVRRGPINVVSQPSLWGVNVAACNILSQVDGIPGGIGHYLLSGSAQSLTSQQMAAGAIKIMQPMKATYQLDLHSPIVATSSDMAQTFATVWRDDVAINFFNQSGVRATPLYCEDPRQVPFQNSEQQMETMWTIDVYLQVNEIVDWPMQFSDNVKVTFKPVDVLS